MNLATAYLGRSDVRTSAGGRVLSLAPNLAREPVAFDAPLKRPVQFREAISALHDVVINDLRFNKRDKTAYEAWKQQQREQESQIRRDALKHARDEALEKRARPLPPDFEREHSRLLKRYWKARRAYADYLLKHDRELWRKLMPCDPIITVANDVVMFECFSADESSYGCLTVERDETFGSSATSQPGTTNVDYSWDLYHHLQGLRTYRQTQFRLDPEGFTVAAADRPEYREEKIDLPAGWLRGFMQIQFAMGLPARRVSLGRAAVYSLLVWLKRHKARSSPRAIRFELLDGRAPKLVLEPWEQPIVSHETRYSGPEGEPIRIWGRQRLLVLARTLPLADGVDVYLLGTGFPSFWVVRMGPMRLTLGLSGWTANDWTRGSALELLAAPKAPTQRQMDAATALLRSQRAATLASAATAIQDSPAMASVVLRHLARSGQAIYDLHAGVYRWRQVMPMALAEQDVASPNAELVGAREIVSRGAATILEQQDAGDRILIRGRAGNIDCEALLDRDGMIRRAQCKCSHFYKYGIRRGPCRHLFALRHMATRGARSGQVVEHL